MKTWTIPVVWEMAVHIEVEANTLEEAADKVGEYVGGSFELWDSDIEMIRECYNNGQADDEEE